MKSIANRHLLSAMLIALLASACQRENSDTSKSADTPAQNTDKQSIQANDHPSNAEPKSAGDVDFPTIPAITIPEFVNTSDVQNHVQDSLGSVINPIKGINIAPASCGADGSPHIHQSLIVHNDGTSHNQIGDGEVITINADGSGSGVLNQLVLNVNHDGSGSIIGQGDSVLTVNADGSGSFTGNHGLIELSGKGAGKWQGTHGVIINNGDGSGSWQGDEGTITINADGSGSWMGTKGVVQNHGDGTGTVNGNAVKMTPIAPLPPAGRFSPLNTLKMPKNPCGFIITLNDQVLFDFDKYDVRPDALSVLDTLVKALADAQGIKGIEISGHTDAKGTDDYNQTLSEKRAQSILDALKSRGLTLSMTAMGYGESKPVAPNELNGKDNPQGRQANRRVEIFIKTQ